VARKSTRRYDTGVMKDMNTVLLATLRAKP
jgi:hypothetical protein